MKKITSAVLATLCLGFAASVQAQNVLTTTEMGEGFQLLFDGKSIGSFNNSWVTYKKGDAANTDLATGWAYSASLQAITSPTNCPDLRSKVMFKDFDFRMEYRNDGNQGVFYRCTVAQPNAWQTGVEFAIDKIPNSSDISAGAAYAMYAPSPFTYKDRSTNAWNTVRIVVIGDSVEHWMNGSKIVGYKYHSADWWKRYKASKWASGTAGAIAWTMSNADPTKQVNSDYIHEGYMGFQGNHGGKWEMRTIRINTNNPYFGPEKTTTLAMPQGGIQGMLGSSYRQSFGRVSLPIANLGVRTASLLAVNGTVRAGEVTSDGHAVFAGLQPGAYFLDLATTSGSYVQKLYILP